MDGNVTCVIRRLCSAAACPTCLFTNQSITLCLPFVIYPTSSAPFSFSLSPASKDIEDLWNINQTVVRWQRWNAPGGMMPLLSTTGTIVLESVNCYPGSAEGSQWPFSPVLSSVGDSSSLRWYTGPHSTTIWLYRAQKKKWNAWERRLSLAAVAKCKDVSRSIGKHL